MLEHLKLEDGAYSMKMHLRPLDPECSIDVDPDTYASELALKDDILRSDYAYYYQVLPGTAALQWETVELLLPNMARFYPQWFDLAMDGERWLWTNALLGTQTTFTLGDPTTLPLPPLDWIGRQVQEDLCLMDGQAPGAPLVAGHLCFASGWCLNDKMGASFLDIHAPVPGFADSIGRPSDLLLQRLKRHRPIARVNWTIHPSDRLNCAPAVKQQYAMQPTGISARNAGQHYFLRSEWQTLARYPRTNAVLFTIRTRVRALAQALSDPADARRLARQLRSMSPQFVGYKGLAPHIEVLLDYLDDEPGRNSPDR